MAEINGTSGNDTLTGTTGDDTVLGLAGNDLLVGDAGADLLQGDTGSDTLHGGGGNDSLDGGAITDRINYTDLNVAVYSSATTGVAVNLQTGTASDGLGGTDTLANLNFVVGSAQNDTLTGSTTANLFEQFEGGLGNDTIDGGAIDAINQQNSNRVNYSSASNAVTVNLAAGTASGAAGDDTLININHVRGSNFGDTLTGSNSTFTEQFEGRAGNDTINGAGGTDMVRYDSATEAVNVSLVTNTALDGQGGTDTLSNIEGIRGSNFNDTLTGGNAANGTGATDGFEFFMGQGGNDTIDGGGGFDRVDYTSSTTGASVTLGGSSNGTASDGLGGTDTLISIEGVRGSEFNDTLTGSDTGTFETFEGRGGNDTIDGKGGTDRVDYTSATAGVTVNLGTSSANDGYGSTDTLLNIEQIRGSAFNDSLTGNTGNNDIQGQAGNDTLSGGDGNDSLDGNAGADSLIGGNGNDYLRGADGANDTLDGGADYDTVNYTFSGTAPVTFTATGATGTQLDGLGGTDTLTSIEEVHIFGGSGGDTLTGDSQRQYIQGNAGNDTLTGGAGTDTFAYDFGQVSGTDRITDLQSGDNFSFNHFGGALVVLDSTIQTGDNPTTLTRGQIMVGVPSGGVTKIYVGTDATAGGDLTIELQGSYLASDFSVINSGFGGSLNYNPGQNLTGTSGNDTINGAGSADTIDGAAGNDNLNGQGGNDSVLGGEGDDYITAGGSGDGGSDTVDGGAGNDVVSYNFGSATAGVTFTASNTGTQVDPLGGTDTLISIEEMHIFGGSGADTLTGNSVRNYMSGNGGNDTLTGGAGNDTFAYDFGQASGTDRITDLQSGDSLTFNHFGGALVVLDSTIQTGDNPATLTRGQIMVGAPAGGVTKIYVGTDATAGGDLTIELQGNYVAGDFSVFNHSFGGNLNYSLGQNLVGTSGNDNLSGGNANDTLTGLDGNDNLYGNGGNDSLLGGNGDDWLVGNGGVDTLDGGAGYDVANYETAGAGIVVTQASGTVPNDGNGSSDVLVGIERIIGSNFADSITGSSGDNDFSGYLGNDTIDGGAGFDFVWYGVSTAAVQVDLQAGTATGGEGNDQLISIEGVGGSRYADNLQGSSGDNYFRGDGASNDSLGGNDTINGQGGFDTVDYRDDPAAVTVNLQTKIAQDGRGGQDSLTSIEEVRGSSFNDSITGSTELYFERFEGRGGNDTIDGGAITDTVNQINGNQVSYRFATAGVTVDLLAGSATGGAGTDVLLNFNEVRGSAFNDTLSGSDRTDVTELFEGREGDDVIDGRGGFDMVRFDNATGGVTASLVSGAATGGGIGNDTFTHIEGLWASSHADVLTGGNAANGTSVSDLLLSEFFMGGGGSDTIDGGQGYDVASYQTSTTGVSVTLNDTLDGVGNDGFGGTDVLRNIEGVRGSAFNDVLTGSNTAAFESFEGREGNDTINGLGGTDRADYGRSKAGVDVNLVSGIALDGYGGTDALSGIENVRGSTFNDVLTGDANVNWLEGRAGNDTLTGGAGNDVFAYSATSTGTDTITDFGVGDIVGIAATLTAGTATAGDGSAVTGKNVQVSSSGGVTTLWIDTNNTAGAEVQVSLVGTFAAGSFTVTDNLDGTSSIALTGGQSLTGTAGNDSITGGNANDTITGLDGADSLNGSGGNDSLDGGNQNDQLRGDAGNDTILGGDGNDFITGGSGDDSINGGAGTGDTADYFFSDTTAAITVNLGTGAVTGGAGNDTLSGIENVNASDFADSITGDANANSLEGRAGNDTLLGLGGSDNLIGGAGNDSLDGGTITDRINYTDLNTVNYTSATVGVNVNLQAGTASDGLGGTDTLANLNFVVGSAQNDTLTGSTTGNLFEQFEGGAGNDTIDGGAIDPVNQQNSNRVNYSSATGAVTVNLAAGTASGAAGSDTLININHVRGGNSADVLTGSNSSLTEQFEGRGGNDTIDGAGGTDMVRYDSATEGVNVSLVTNTAIDGLGSTDTLSNIEGIRGSNFNDTLTGGNAANGTGTTDGFEFFHGLGGNDTIDGGGGYDRVDYTNSTTGASVTLGGSSNGTASDGLGGTDTLINIEAVRGSDFNDTLTGSDSGTFESFEGRAGNDTIDGKGGTDRIDYQSASAGVVVSLSGGSASDGYGGTDTFSNIENVRGSAFNDQLKGDANVNWLEGGAGNDTLYGFTGNDVFVFAPSGVGVDTILDFEAGDIVGIGATLAAGTATAGDGSAVTGKNVQVSSSGGVTTLWIDTNNVAGAELQINLTGTFAASSFTVTDNLDGRSSITRTSALTLTGTAGNDTLTGGSDNDTIDGLAGNDTLDGGAGNDSLIGGSGDDWFISGAGADTLDGGSGFDRANYVGATAGIVVNLATGTASSDGSGSADTLLGIERVMGSDFADSITGSGADDDFSGNLGNDTLDGGAGFDFVWYGGATAAVQIDLQAGTATGGEGNDQLISIEGIAGSRYADNLQGSAVDNYFRGDGGLTDMVGGNDTINGQGGFDVVDYRDDPAAVTVNLQTKIAQDGRGGQDSLTSIEEVRGSNFNDSITGSTDLWFERFEGRDGNDTIDGGAITDTVNQTNGNQVSYRYAGAAVTVDLLAGSATGGAGTDVLSNINEARGSAFNDTLSGSNRTDVTELFEGREGDDVIDGRGGFDIVRFDTATSSVTASLVSGTATGGGIGNDTFTNMEGLWGSSHGDVLTGGNAANGTVATDPALSEFFVGGGGSDIIDGGQGYDLVSYQTSTVGVTVTLNDTLDGVGTDGFGGTDVLRNIEGVRGSAQNDVLTGSNTAAFESFEGREGNDTINGLGGTDRADYARSKAGVVVNLATGAASDGYGGTDTLTGIENVRGSTFNDTLTGDANANRLEGGLGNDTLTGGAGSDVFAFGASGMGVDAITDFAAGDVVGIGAALTTATATAGDGSAVTGKNVQVSSNAGVTTLWIDTNAVAGAELQINLTGTFTANQFIVKDNGNGTSSITLASGQALTGTSGNDTLSGTGGNDTLAGLAGNDVLNGGAGNDNLDGGADTDTASYAGATGAVTAYLWSGQATGADGTDTLTNIENLTGSGFDDRLDGGNTANSLDGGAGADTVNGFAGNDTLTGGAGNDALDGGADIDTASYAGATVGVTALLWNGQSTGEGTDTLASIENLTGSGFNDRLDGENTANNLSGGAGADSLYGYGGNDTLVGGAGNDVLDGSADIDTASFAGATGAVTVLLWNGQASGADGTDSLVSIENLTGSGFNDRLDGDNSVNVLDGGAGADTLLGYDGNDTLIGGAGNDSLTGGNGNDTFRFAASANGIDTIADLTLDDTILVEAALGAISAGDGSAVTGKNVQVSSSAGVTTLWIDTNSAAGAEVQINIAGTYAASNLKLVDNGNGTSSITRAAALNLSGTAGNDTLTGAATNDTLSGLAGNDVLIGGAGNDSLDGGADSDTASYAGATGAVTALLWNGQATGADGTDILSGIENLTGSGFNDRLDGENTANNLSGGAGADSLYGYGGNDTLVGGAGNDVMDGGTDFDTASFAGATGAVTAFLWSGQATGDGSDTMSSIENLTGSGFNDRLDGDNSVNVLDGGVGADTLLGYDGNDTLIGGAGNDSLTGGNGNDTFRFAASANGIDTIADLTLDDTILVEAALGAISAGDGSAVTGKNVQVSSSAGVTTLWIDTNSAAGAEVQINIAGTYTASNLSLVNNGNGTSSITRAAALNLSGTAGNDTLTGAGTNDTLSGLAGNDVLIGGAGNDNLDGGADSDTASFAGATGAVTAYLWGSQATGADGTDALISIENLVGSGFNDRLDGDNSANSLSGGDGADSLYGYAGNDTLSGGAGNDVLDGSTDIDTATYATATGAVVAYLWSSQVTGDGTDTLTSIENLIGSGFNDRLDGTNDANSLDGGAGADSLLGYGGNDTLTGGAGNDLLDGGADVDTVNYSGATGAITAYLWSSQATGDGTDTLYGIETLIGSGFNDRLDGDNSANNLNGGVGADTLYAYAGNDTVIGGAGNDVMDGGADTDTASYAGATGAVTVYLWSGQATGADGSDTLGNFENLIGSGFNDRLDGTNSANILEGGAGADTVFGYAGSDTLTGGAGNDVLDGGADADAFVFDAGSGADLVYSFATAQSDKIHLKSGLNGSGIASAAQALAATTDVGGYATVNLGSGHTITLVGVTTASLSAADFVIF